MIGLFQLFRDILCTLFRVRINRSYLLAIPKDVSFITLTEDVLVVNEFWDWLNAEWLYKPPRLLRFFFRGRVIDDARRISLLSGGHTSCTVIDGKLVFYH